MRSISLVDHIQFKLDGNVNGNAITIGDCDNDLANELVAATVEGDLYVFKGTQQNAWALSTGLGTVVSVTVGDILNIKKNCIVCVSVEGFCNIFSIDSDLTPKAESSVRTNLSSKSNTIPDSDEKSQPKLMSPFHTQRLPANAKVVCLADIDNDGQNEFIVGLTDRVVRTYRCVRAGDKIKLVGLHKWELIDQIGTLSLNPSPVQSQSNSGQTGDTRTHNILVAQPGATYAKLECLDKKRVLISDDPLTNSDTLSKLTPEYNELSMAKMRNKTISTEIVGGIKGPNRVGDKIDSLIALATHDGTLMLADGKDLLWSMQVDHQLFALSKLSITPDDREEIIACSWDGLTSIIDQNRDAVRFKFEEPVSAFIAGHYTLSPSEPDVKCLVYATFNKSIYLYYNIEINRIKCSDFREAVNNCPELVSDLKTLLQRLGVDSTARPLHSVCSDILHNSPNV